MAARFSKTCAGFEKNMDNTEFEKKEKLYKWLKSQQRWHSKRQGKWHKSNERFYKRKAAIVFTFNEIVARTIRIRRKEIVNSFFK